jgi:hypothetical protein
LTIGRKSLLLAASVALGAVSGPPMRVGISTDMTAATSGAPGIPPGRLIHVPADVATPKLAIDAAEPGDVILLAAGTYQGGLTVPEVKHDITIRGEDRSGVVFDGKGFDLDAVEVDADGVTLENLSAHDFGGNGFYWEEVEGFVGRYLTVWDVNLYGMYATESHGGTFDHDLVSGAADAAFYVGECQPCDTTVTDVEGRLSAIGYSGTNTGAGMAILSSTWDRNGTGILPNSFEGQAAQPPESQSTIDGNTVPDSGTVPVPAHTPLAGFIGIGIGVAGGSGNTISNNTITGSDRYGIALFPTIQQGGATFAASANTIRGNAVSGSGSADLALAPMLGNGGDPNCFDGNAVGSSLPKDLATVQACGSAVGMDGDPAVGADLSIPVPDALDKLAAAGPRPDYRTMPVPEAQPNTPDALPAGLRPFRDAGPGVVVIGGALALVIAVGLGILLVVFRRRRSR